MLDHFSLHIHGFLLNNIFRALRIALNKLVILFSRKLGSNVNGNSTE